MNRTRRRYHAIEGRSLYAPGSLGAGGRPAGAPDGIRARIPVLLRASPELARSEPAVHRDPGGLCLLDPHQEKAPGLPAGQSGFHPGQRRAGHAPDALLLRDILTELDSAQSCLDL